jgi:hypothetical protein
MKRPSQAWLVDLILILLLLFGIFLRVGLDSPAPETHPWTPPPQATLIPTLTVTPGWWSTLPFPVPEGDS